jgi:hypothetical protein
MSELEDRKIEAQAGRSQLMARIGEIRERVQPASLLDDVKGATRKKAIAVATAAVSQRKAHALIALGAISAGLTYLFRRPLLNALAKRLQTEKDDDK